MLCHLLSFLLTFFFRLLLVLLAAVTLICLSAAVFLALGFLLGPECVSRVIRICDNDFLMAFRCLTKHQPLVNFRSVLQLLLLHF